MRSIDDPSQSPCVVAIGRVAALAVEAEQRMADYQGKTAADPYPPVVHEALQELTGAVTAMGVARRDAEYAVAQWMIQRLPIEDCVREQQTEEARRNRRSVRELGERS